MSGSRRLLLLSKGLFNGKRFKASRPHRHADDHHAEEVDDQGHPYNEMTALPFNRQAGVKEPVDWQRRIFVVGYMGGFGVFCYFLYYKPDTTIETWALKKAEERMRSRGVDMFWWEKEKYSATVQ